jgi:hypothetical protein
LERGQHLVVVEGTQGQCSLGGNEERVGRTRSRAS